MFLLVTSIEKIRLALGYKDKSETACTVSSILQVKCIYLENIPERILFHVFKSDK